jgi:hypothetical protein
MRAESVVAALALSGLLAGCTAFIDGDDATGGESDARGNGASGAGASAGPGPGTNPEVCKMRPSLGVDPLRLLTKREYETTLRELFGKAAVDALAPQLAQLPDRHVAHGFRSMAKGTTGSEVEAYLMIADALSLHMTADEQRLSALDSCLGAAPVAADCARTFITSFGQRLYRRPLTEAETAALELLHAEGAALGDYEGVSLVLFAMLQAPPFLYRLETEGAARADNPNSFDLTAYEIATRLSYLAWGSGPDQELLGSAASGSLTTSEGIAAELQRLLSDPRAAARQAQFFSEWLETEQLPTVNQGPDYLAGIASDGLADAMREETDQFVRSLAFTGEGTFRDLMTSNVAFVASPALAQIYGVERSSAADGRIELDASRRAGILTRAALLLSPGEETSPIRRGAFVRRKLLCDSIPPPDPEAFPPGAIQPPEFDADTSNRERWTAKTSQGACGGCHALLNPFGFALENYDNIGRYRTSEVIVDPSTGLPVNELPIVADVDAPLDGGELVPVSGGAVGLGAALAASRQAQECFGRQWFRFVSGREETSDDACVLAEMTEAVASGASLRATFERIALSPEFRMRRIDGQ